MTHEFVKQEGDEQWFVIAEDRRLEDAEDAGRWIKTTELVEIDP